MSIPRMNNDSVHWYVGEIASRIIAESGIATDRYHLGKILLQCLKDDPDFVLQIEGATGESETFGSVIERTVKCANCFKNMGLGHGDVMILMAPNHLDITIPLYAALYLGIIVAAIDRTLTASRCTDFDPEDSVAFLIATSGTTGLPKAAAVTYKNFAIITPYVWSRYTKFPTPTRLSLVGSPLQWLSAILNFILSPLLRFTRLQTTLPLTQEHAYDLINTYKPTYTVLSPTLMTTLIKPDDRDRCDFSSFELILLGGSAVPQTLIEELKTVAPDAEIMNCFGMSELGGIAFHGDNIAPGSCGKPLGCFQYRIINVDTQEDIYEPNVPGELWLKGPSIFKEYYNNAEATEETFAEDRWFKTGDTFYRDENWNFFFVERIKLLLKYKSYQISPVEIEEVIRQHPGVLDVAVTGIPDEECGDLPVAVVVPRPGDEPTADDIKNCVKDELTQIFKTNQPTIIICQSEKTGDVDAALQMLKMDTKVVTFNEDNHYTTLSQLLKVDDAAITNFKPTDFDPAETVAYLTSTSGTTGVPKTAMLTHKNLSIGIRYIWIEFSKFPTPTRMVIVTSPAQWLSAGFHYLFSPIMKYTRLQTSATVTPEHFGELVNKYKPTYILISPTLMTTMMSKAKCDFNCFENIQVGGSAVTQEFLADLKKITNAKIYILYGMSEVSGPTLQQDDSTPPGSYGRPIGGLELKGYYNNEEMTKETLTEDGWLKSGDILYRDEAWNLFFVERYKLLLKYRNHQVSPSEVESVIMKHPGVFQAAVTGIPDRECGDLVVACVVPKPGCSPAAQEIKDLVKESLTDSKQLRGGVIFLKELPTTSTSKIDRKKLKEMVLDLPRE
ncbi:hypothetical protein HF086_007811 [Spodoptera exigua]|uniref:Luciferase n=1 Tax=Spodoptera exigua TaxID=7107 RepID=A0A922MIY4_SPOEX|nr:hypothetical protein HF086_007811 [Spodoptera exigua]